MATVSFTIAGGAAPFIVSIREAGDPTTTNRLNPNNNPYNTTSITATYDAIPDGEPHTYIVSVSNPNASTVCATDIQPIANVTCPCVTVPSLSVTSNVVDPKNPFLIITPTISNGNLIVVVVKDAGNNTIFITTNSTTGEIQGVASGSVLNVPVPGITATYSVVAYDASYPKCLNSDSESITVTNACTLNITVGATSC